MTRSRRPPVGRSRRSSPPTARPPSGRWSGLPWRMSDPPIQRRRSGGSSPPVAGRSSIRETAGPSTVGGSRSGSTAGRKSSLNACGAAPTSVRSSPGATRSVRFGHWPGIVSGSTLPATGSTARPKSVSSSIVSTRLPRPRRRRTPRQGRSSCGPIRQAAASSSALGSPRSKWKPRSVSPVADGRSSFRSRAHGRPRASRSRNALRPTAGRSSG